MQVKAIWRREGDYMIPTYPEWLTDRFAAFYIEIEDADAGEEIPIAVYGFSRDKGPMRISLWVPHSFIEYGGVLDDFTTREDGPGARFFRGQGKDIPPGQKNASMGLYRDR